MPSPLYAKRRMEFTAGWSTTTAGTAITPPGWISFLPFPGYPLDYLVENVNGIVELKDASGNCEISLVNGDVLASMFTGPLSIEVVNGELTVDDCPGLERAELVNGSLFCNIWRKWPRTFPCEV